MGIAYNPKIVTDSVVCCVDFANQKNWTFSTNTAVCIFTGIPFTANNTSYVSVTDGAATFTRAATAPTIAEKNVAGGTIKTNSLSSSGYTAAKYQNFYYNDHTFEVLFRINDTAASNYDATETSSILVGHRGYNNGFSFNGTNVFYTVWNGTTGANNILTWSVSSEVPTGSWNYIGVTRSGSTWTKYRGGVPISSATQTPAVNNSSTGTLGDIGLGATLVIGSNYQYYGKCSIALFRMYSRALTDDEIYQNFLATRSRYNL